jgi:hypothetical protein
MGGFFCKEFIVPGLEVNLIWQCSKHGGYMQYRQTQSHRGLELIKAYKLTWNFDSNALTIDC